MPDVIGSGRDDGASSDHAKLDRRDRASATSQIEWEDFAYCYYYEWKEKHKLAERVKALERELEDARRLRSALQDERDRLHATSLQAVQQADRARAIAGWAVAALIIGSVIGWFW